MVRLGLAVARILAGLSNGRDGSPMGGETDVEGLKTIPTVSLDERAEGFMDGGCGGNAEPREFGGRKVVEFDSGCGVTRGDDGLGSRNASRQSFAELHRRRIGKRPIEAGPTQSVENAGVVAIADELSDASQTPSEFAPDHVDGVMAGADNIGAMAVADQLGDGDAIGPRGSGNDFVASHERTVT